MPTTRALILARGLGTRMRAADPAAQLTAGQARAADAGLKPMIPINGRPFLDYLLSALADAGITDAALVVAPDHQVLFEYYMNEAPPSRLRVTFVVQPEPRGTADAVIAAQRWTNSEPFLAMNADNLYPTVVLADLAALDEPGLPAFERDDLMRSSNISAARVQSFALIELDDRGYLTAIVEKPPLDASPASAEQPVASAFRRTKKILISMNAWRFDSRIFGACRDVPRSPRGEYELPEAVGVAVRRGVKFKAIPARGPVLDLSRRGDAADVADRLAAVVPRP